MSQLGHSRRFGRAADFRYSLRTEIGGTGRHVSKVPATNISLNSITSTAPISSDIETATLLKFARSGEAASRSGLRAADDLSKIEPGHEKSRLAAASLY
jgi:hypothetical protein